MKVLVILAVLLCLLFPLRAKAQDDGKSASGESMLFDLIFLRPLGVGACAVGVAASILSIPFNLANPEPEHVVRKFVKEPFEYTFLRPLGYIPSGEKK